MKAIETIGLTKYYGSARGIIDLNLSVEEGGFFGFLGPNGAGKSTTIRILLGLISPTSGTAKIFGRTVGMSPKEILSEIGYLSSDAAFYSGMKVSDILKLSAQLRGKDCSKEASALCERLSLDPSRRVDELSLGNRKKVGIVCTMQHKPRLYIMDEPTSGLDPLIQREFYSILSERNAEGATVFLSCHVLSEVQRYCREAAVIRDGRLLVSSSVESLAHTGAKRVALRGVTALPSLADIRDITMSEDSISFLYGGAPSELLRALAPLPITDITISEPDMEEVFMHYYEGGVTNDNN